MPSFSSNAPYEPPNWSPPVERTDGILRPETRWKPFSDSAVETVRAAMSDPRRHFLGVVTRAFGGGADRECVECDMGAAASTRPEAPWS